MEQVDVLVVGAGPAGLAAAYAARLAGASVLVVEREAFAGGVLPQCVHDGFGQHLYGVSLTGPEYVARWEKMACDAGVQFWFSTTVFSVKTSKHCFSVQLVGAAAGGALEVQARAVVVATGCRERTRGELNIPGSRPFGVMTAGTAQYMMNVRNQLPGDKVVILGSGDIGLIMARRLSLEGADVRMVLGAEGTGLLRNHIRCIQDFNIPYREGWGVVSVSGNGKLHGVTIAPLDNEGQFAHRQREYIRCNVLLLACGLIPEREILSSFDLSEGTIKDKKGVHDKSGAHGIFICGNAERPHDLVDQVTQEALQAGLQAAAHALGCSAEKSIPAFPKEAREHLSAQISEPKGSVRDVEVREGMQAIPCTVCPTGCIVYVRNEGDKAGECEGNACARGVDYARAELANPKRIFTGTVRVDACEHPLVPVRTSGEVVRDALLDVAREVKRLRLRAPVCVGDVICENIAGTGVKLIATANRECA